MALNDSEIIDRIGVDDYYKHERKLFVKLCKEKGLSQSKSHTAINIWLKSESQKPVSLSYVKKYWN
ncbi:hypothetical protein PY093_11135 [Cytobacillus sp. S13-E01]|uniref:hypothetical protein n=1 Tax=Cytobacillus sp. S13-E01 TaxID=3031326 RepID=UPI0023D88588|nr:hypothetical protein [Cytobacillus sp. S13-E01]MDF0727252.1 hypothetical protein [Cytobacillus sp. S13-E01]